MLDFNYYMAIVFILSLCLTLSIKRRYHKPISRYPSIMIGALLFIFTLAGSTLSVSMAQSLSVYFTGKLYQASVINYSVESASAKSIYQVDLNDSIEVHSAEVRFHVDGVPLDRSLNFATATPPKIGDKQWVFYNADNNSITEFDIGSTSLLIAGFVLGLLMLCPFIAAAQFTMGVSIERIVGWAKSLVLKAVFPILILTFLSMLMFASHKAFNTNQLDHLPTAMKFVLLGLDALLAFAFLLYCKKVILKNK